MLLHSLIIVVMICQSRCCVHHHRCFSELVRSEENLTFVVAKNIWVPANFAAKVLHMILCYPDQNFLAD
jgi:hypothetical protein